MRALDPSNSSSVSICPASSRLAENKEAIDDANADMAKHGLFSDEWRKF
jgi:hypothetical protein